MRIGLCMGPRDPDDGVRREWWEVELDAGVKVETFHRAKREEFHTLGATSSLVHPGGVQWEPAAGEPRADVTKFIRGYVTVNCANRPRMSAYRRISNPRICEYLCEL